MSVTVFLIAGIIKFSAGAWASLLIVIVFTVVALVTRRHFDRVDDAIALPATQDSEGGQTPSGSPPRHRPNPRLDRVSSRVLAYAVLLRQPVLGAREPTEEESKRFREYWHAWG
jgi:hypothetical protein